MKRKDLPGGESISCQSELRCLNCFERIFVSGGTERITCTKCKMEWRISWANPHIAKIRGPVWDKISEIEKELKPNDTKS